jgi:hypothetical protein
MRRMIIFAALLMLCPVNARAAGLSDLGWLPGEWVMARPDGSLVTEMWLRPEQGVMPGLGRTLKGRSGKVEFMRIEERDGRLTFTAIPDGQATTVFVATSQTADQVVFENLDHDFPQRVIYGRCEEDLCAAIEGQVNGKLKRIEWRYQRVGD